MNQDIETTLRGVGLRVTPGRIALMQVLSAAQYPLSIADILAALKSHRMDEVTVYRAIDSFVKARLVQPVAIDPTKMHYELASKEHHHHITCEQCGHIEDVHVCAAQSLEKKIMHESKAFASIQRHSFELFGTCLKCASQR